MSAYTQSTTARPDVNPPAREIRFDRATADFAMYLDGALVGYAANAHAAELALDALVYAILTHPHTLPLADGVDAALTDMLADACAAERVAFEDSDAHTYALRRLRAVERAIEMRAAGIEPQSLGGGRWSVASRTQPRAAYTVGADGCSCAAGKARVPCFHAALVGAVERAQEAMDLA